MSSQKEEASYFQHIRSDLSLSVVACLFIQRAERRIQANTRSYISFLVQYLATHIYNTSLDYRLL